VIREIVIFGDPVLRKKCDLVKNFSEDINALADDMLETMASAEGIGLAAPQVGIPMQLAVVDVSHDPECISYLRVDGKNADLLDMMPLIFVNPELEFDGEQDVMSEGCLSFPEIRGEVTRPYELKAKVKLMNGNTVTIETDGLLSRAIQHETDHLNGVLFIDRMSAATRIALRGKVKRMQRDYGMR